MFAMYFLRVLAACECVSIWLIIMNYLKNVLFSSLEDDNEKDLVTFLDLIYDN